MHAALEHAERSDRERRSNVVDAFAYGIWVWRLTKDHPKRRLEIAVELIDRLKEEHARWADLTPDRVLAALANLSGKQGAVYLAGKLGGEINASGDRSASKPSDNYQKAVAARRKRRR